MKTLPAIAVATTLASAQAIAQENKGFSLDTQISMSLQNEYHDSLVPTAFSESAVVQHRIDFTLTHPKMPVFINCFAWNNFDIRRGRRSVHEGMTETDGGCWAGREGIEAGPMRIDAKAGWARWGYLDSFIGNNPDDIIAGEVRVHAAKNSVTFTAARLIAGDYMCGDAYGLLAKRDVPIARIKGGELLFEPEVSASYAKQFFVFDGLLGASAGMHGTYTKGRISVSVQVEYTKGTHPLIETGPHYGISLQVRLPHKKFSK